MYLSSTTGGRLKPAGPSRLTALAWKPFPAKHGSTYKPVPGFDLQILDELGQPLPRGEMGKMALKLPMPPGCLLTLWGKDQDYIDAYLSMHEGYYMTWDAGYIDEDGDAWVMSRLGDVINVAGHRLSTGRNGRSPGQSFLTLRNVLL